MLSVDGIFITVTFARVPETTTDTKENSVYFAPIQQTQKPQQENQDRTHIRTLPETGED